MPNKTRKQKGSAMPLSYLNRNYIEPSGPAGSNVSGAEPGLARASLNLTGGRRSRSKTVKGGKCGCLTKGGFYPSVMGNFVANTARLIPAMLFASYRMFKNSKTKTRKQRR
jgi:hypothetical protein